MITRGSNNCTNETPPTSEISIFAVAGGEAKATCFRLSFYSAAPRLLQCDQRVEADFQVP